MHQCQPCDRPCTQRSWLGQTLRRPCRIVSRRAEPAGVHGEAQPRGTIINKVPVGMKMSPELYEYVLSHNREPEVRWGAVARGHDALRLTERFHCTNSLVGCQQETPPTSAHPTSATTSPPRGGSRGPRGPASSAARGGPSAPRPLVEQFPDARFHFNRGPLAQRVSFKGVWLNAEWADWALLKLLQGEE
jgi:hypothetical protein